MRTLAIVAALVILAGRIAAAQPTKPAVEDDHAATATTTASKDAADTGAWSFSASAYAYFVPDDEDYVQPTITADRDWLHLEARYNYEAQDTASAFVGWNFSAGDNLVFEGTPMLGVVFGETDGVAPGYRLSLTYARFELYSEGEYLFDLEDDSDSYFYTWSELSWAATEWLRVGLAIQRTRAYESDVDVQRGLLVGLSYRSIDFTTYVFNLDQDDPMVVLAVGFSF